MVRRAEQGLAAALDPARLVRSWRSRVAVRGHSMVPTLRDGDCLLVDPDSYRARGPERGELVVAETRQGLIVKRVAEILADGTLLLTGDAPSNGAHDHEATVPSTLIAGRPWFRYWPAGRIGPVR